MICEHCYEKIPDDSRICPNCKKLVVGLGKDEKGKGQGRAPLYDKDGNLLKSGSSKGPKEKKGNKGLIPIILVSIVLVISLVVVIGKVLSRNESVDKSMDSEKSSLEQSHDEEASVKESLNVDTESVFKSASEQIITESHYTESLGDAEIDKTETSFDKDTADSYFWPDSFDRLYTYSDLEGLSKDQVRWIRAEIYARAGMIFNDKKYQEYFSGKSWYSPEVEEQLFNNNKHLGYYAIENLRMIETYLREG